MCGHGTKRSFGRRLLAGARDELFDVGQSLLDERPHELADEIGHFLGRREMDARRAFDRLG